MSKLLVKKLSKMNFFQFGKTDKEISSHTKDNKGKIYGNFHLEKLSSLTL